MKKFMPVVVATVSMIGISCYWAKAQTNLPSTKIAQASPEVKIKEFAYAGSGCPKDSVASLLSEDGQVLELLFDKFQANLAPSGVKVDYPPQNNCSVSLKLDVPPGFSVSWHRVEHRGFADTSGGATGELRARYYIPGEGGFDENRNYSIKKGSVADYTVVHDAISTAYTKCGIDVPMTVNTRVRLSGTATKYNALTVDSQSNKVTTKLYFKYNKCKN